MRLLLAALLMLCASACNPYSWGQPDDAYASFVRALARDEHAVAYRALSSETRRLLEARLEALAQASGGMMRNDAVLTSLGGVRPVPLQDLKVVKRDGDRATLSGRADDQVLEVQMIREQNEWKVDLTNALKMEAQGP